MSPQPTDSICSSCGEAVPPDAPLGQCPRCLLGLASGEALARGIGADLLDPGQVRHVGDYELLEEVARGGMGVVYRARQISLGREVALKMLLAGELATPETVQRFRNEAAAAARLEHPHIVPVYEIGEHETQHFFSMRFVPGRRDIAAWARDLPPEGRSRAIATMMRRVADALAFAHDRGVLHRDLKPSNILVDEAEAPQVTDFGLAKLIRGEDSGLTQTAAVMGSPSYMAPEQAEGRHDEETTATDVYGLGAVLYEMLAGRPPFVGNSPLSTAKKVVDEPPPRLEGVPRDLATICLKCLAKIPGHRYDSAHALAEDLGRFARGEPILARPMTLPEALWSWARRRPKIAALLGMVLLAFVIGFAGVSWQWFRAEEAIRHLRWLEVVRQAESEEAPLALARLAGTLREDPANWQAAMLAMSVVEQQAFPVLAGPPVLPEAKLSTPPLLSSDGDWFAAGAEDGTLRVWNTETAAARPPVPLGSPATALATGAGRLALVAATEDGRVLAFENPDNTPIDLDGGDGGKLLELALCGDGSKLLARSEGRVRVWNAEALGAPSLFDLGEGKIGGAVLSGDGSRLLLWSAKRAVVSDTASGEVVRELSAGEAFRHGHLSGDGARVALVDGSYAIRSWDVEEGRELAAIDSGVTFWKRVLLNRDGSRLVAMGSSNDLVIFDPVSGLAAAPPLRHLYGPSTLLASADGARLASFGDDGRALVWDFATGQKVVEAVWNDAQDGAALGLSRDGSRLLVHPRSLRAGEPTIAVWKGSATRPPQIQRVEGARDFFATRLSPDGTLGCLGFGPERRTLVYEIATGRTVFESPTRGDVYAHLFSPDQQRYYALTANGWLHGWDLETGEELWTPEQQPGRIRPAAISPDGSRIVAGHNDGHLRIYDTATGRQVLALEHPGEIKVVRFAPDGSGRFLSASTDRLAHVWDLASGKKLATMEGHGFTIIAGGWSPDGRLVATASYDQTARLWDAATGKPVGRPMPHLAWLSHLEIGPDGRHLATACRDGSVRLWRVPSGRPASPPLPLGDTALTVRFTADSRALLARDHSGFRFFGVEKAEPVTRHYPAPMSSGLGIDAETLRAIMTADGGGVHLGHSMNAGEYWTVPQPRAPVPPWFPEFLEALAGMRETGPGEVRLVPARVAAETVPREGGGPYAEWARGVLR
jgi:WD40 repeat protein